MSKPEGLFYRSNENISVVIDKTYRSGDALKSYSYWRKPAPNASAIAPVLSRALGAEDSALGDAVLFALFILIQLL